MAVTPPAVPPVSPPAATAPAAGVAASRSQTALVTGAARRLGREIALGLARAGWDIAIHCHRSGDEALQTARDVHALGRRAEVFTADLADAARTVQLLDRAHDAMGPITCLVNNASLFEFDDPASFEAANLGRHIGPNLAAPLLLTRRLHELLETSDLADPKAVVIHLLDQKVANLNPDFFSYTLTKSALLAGMQMTATAFAPRLRINAVSPGATYMAWQQSAQDFEQARRIALLGHSSTPADIVQAVVYLAGARAVTGVNLAVDGGQHLMPLARDVMFLGKAS